MTDSQPVPKQQAQNVELMDFVDFVELLKKRSNSQRSSNLQKKFLEKKDSCPPANPHS